MVLEIATIETREGAAETFAAAMRETGLDALRACEGVQSVKFGQGVENPSTFTFLVEWDSIEAHQAVKDSEDFARFRAAFGDCAAGGSMQHFTID